MAIPGSVVAAGKLVTPGGAQGPTGPNAVSTDSGNIATLGSDGLVLVPQSTIWSQRLRTFNSVGNPNFEVDQRCIHGGSVNPATGTFVCDRYSLSKNGTMTINTGNPNLSGANSIPGIPFGLSTCQFSLQLMTQQASLAAGDYLSLYQTIEGCNWREMANDVTSFSLMVYSSVAPLKFSVAFRDSPVTKTLVKLCTVPVANTWTVIQLPNIPKPTGGNFGVLPGVVGMSLTVNLACGSTYIAPAADTWQNGNFVGCPGMDNWCANPITSSVFYLGFLQHEPLPVCSTFIDKPFDQNYDECLRYYHKSYPYGVAAGSVSSAGCPYVYFPANSQPYVFIPWRRTMAKTPNILGYSNTTGAVNMVRNVSGGDLAISGSALVGDNGFSGFNLTSPPSTLWVGSFNYVADTGW